MELQSGAKLAAQCVIFRYDRFAHWQRRCQYAKSTVLQL